MRPPCPPPCPGTRAATKEDMTCLSLPSPAAAHRDVGAGDVGGLVREEVEGDTRRIRGRAHVARGDVARDGLQLLLAHRARVDEARRDRVDGDVVPREAL